MRCNRRVSERFGQRGGTGGRRGERSNASSGRNDGNKGRGTGLCRRGQQVNSQSDSSCDYQDNDYQEDKLQILKTKASRLRKILANLEERIQAFT